MVEKTVSLDIFERRLLGCVKDSKQTGEEIRNLYIQLFPQGVVAKVIMPPVPLIKIEVTLLKLVTYGLVQKEVTRFTDKPLKHDTLVYVLSDAGRKMLTHKKQKQN